MIPRNRQNRKIYTNLACPNCGMELTDPDTDGFVFNNETYCCEGCAKGTGCTCQERRFKAKKAGNRPGDLGQRNVPDSAHAKHPLAHRFPSHETVSRTGKKLPRGVAKKRPSTRDQSRGNIDEREVFASKNSVPRTRRRVGSAVK